VLTVSPVARAVVAMLPSDFQPVGRARPPKQPRVPLANQVNISSFLQPLNADTPTAPPTAKPKAKRKKGAPSKPIKAAKEDSKVPNLVSVVCVTGEQNGEEFVSVSVSARPGLDAHRLSIVCHQAHRLSPKPRRVAC
jgi:hypothetical protein